jgi:hypothetical protein
MSRATTWIWAGIGLFVPGSVIVTIGISIQTTQGAGGGIALFLGAMLALAGLFAIQVGVVALAVSIGVWELRQDVRTVAGQEHGQRSPSPQQTPSAVPPPPPY